MSGMEYGFVTLATGSDFYYKSAYKMLKSYRYQGGKCRFCIVCDRENEYTRKFDDVILLKNCKFDYSDKFELLKVVPYKKNIFIEPDCLVYKNIDDFWQMFKDATPVAAFGYNDGDLRLWFNDTELVHEIFNVYKIPVFNPGYLYIEKNIVSEKCYDDLIKISQKIINDDRFLAEEKIFVGSKLRDDPIFCLAMERNNCECTVEQKESKCISLPAVIKINSAKLSEGKLDVLYNLNGEKTVMDDCYLLHFSSRRLKEWLYFQQVLVLHCLTTKGLSWLSHVVESQFFGKIVRKAFKIKSELLSFCEKSK